MANKYGDLDCSNCKKKVDWADVHWVPGRGRQGLMSLCFSCWGGTAGNNNEKSPGPAKMSGYLNTIKHYRKPGF